MRLEGTSVPHLAQCATETREKPGITLVLGDLSKFEVSTRWKIPGSTHISVIIQGKILYIYLIKNVHRGLYQPMTELEEIYILAIIFNCSL